MFLLVGSLGHVLLEQWFVPCPSVFLDFISTWFFILSETSPGFFHVMAGVYQDCKVINHKGFLVLNHLKPDKIGIKIILSWRHLRFNRCRKKSSQGFSYLTAEISEKWQWPLIPSLGWFLHPKDRQEVNLLKMSALEELYSTEDGHSYLCRLILSQTFLPSILLKIFLPKETYLLFPYKPSLLPSFPLLK